MNEKELLIYFKKVLVLFLKIINPNKNIYNYEFFRLLNNLIDDMLCNLKIISKNYLYIQDFKKY